MGGGVLTMLGIMPSGIPAAGGFIGVAGAGAPGGGIAALFDWAGGIALTLPAVFAGGIPALP